MQACVTRSAPTARRASLASASLKKDVYCCTASKISRIRQEQGRPHTGKPWGKPKTETCEGFSIFEFQQLDLSVMDFSEVYADFMEAAKLPDEAAALVQIQQKITDYYAAHKPMMLQRSRISLAVLAALLAASTTLAIAADRNGDGVEVEQQEDALYCKERRLGTWFYCEKPKEAPRTTAAPQASARDRLAAISTSLEELKARAILEPSPENVTAYVRFQREQLDRSSMFADVWQRALWQDPGLDYTLQRPVSTLGKRAWIDQRKGDRDLVMAQLSQRYGVFYFYASSCGACDIFSPILKAVSDKYGLSVLAVSMDGGPSAVFPGYMVDSGQYERLGMGTDRQVPALVLFDSVTKQPMPIGYGILSQDEIMDRVFQLTQVAAGSDY
jgi:conjugal transfer pilus assembly protein TraF